MKEIPRGGPGRVVLGLATFAGLGVAHMALAQVTPPVPAPNPPAASPRSAATSRPRAVLASPSTDPALVRAGLGHDAGVASAQAPAESCPPPAPPKPQPTAPVPPAPPPYAPVAPQPMYAPVAPQPMYVPVAPQPMYAPVAPQPMYAPVAPQPMYAPVAPQPAPMVPNNLYLPPAPVAPPSYAPVAPQPMYAPVAPQPMYLPVAAQPAPPVAAPPAGAALTNQAVSVPASRSSTRTRVRGPGLINSSLARLGERLTQLGRTRIETVQETELAPPVAQTSGGFTTISTTGLVPQPTAPQPPPTAPQPPPPPPPPTAPTPSPQGGPASPHKHSLIQHLLGHDPE